MVAISALTPLGDLFCLDPIRLFGAVLAGSSVAGLVGLTAAEGGF